VSFIRHKTRAALEERAVLANLGSGPDAQLAVVCAWLEQGGTYRSLACSLTPQLRRSVSATFVAFVAKRLLVRKGVSRLDACVEAHRRIDRARATGRRLITERLRAVPTLVASTAHISKRGGARLRQYHALRANINAALVEHAALAPLRRRVVAAPSVLPPAVPERSLAYA
jgi:hypothetical protein